MSLESLQERLRALNESVELLKNLIDRLAKLKFQPGSVPLSTEEEGSPSGELSAEITQLLRNGFEDQELLLEEAQYLRPEGHDKTRLTDGVERLGVELVSCRSAFRAARIAAKRSLDDAHKQERILLIKSFSVTADLTASPLPVMSNEVALPAPTHQNAWRPSSKLQHSSLTEHDRQTVGASGNVTDALRRTHDLIATELSRSEFAHQTLEESTAALKQLGESYLSLDTMLANSRHLVGTLLRSQKSDTWYLQTSLYMLLVTSAWLVFRRLLYGPTWWLVWLPLRILFGIGTKMGSAVVPMIGNSQRDNADTLQMRHQQSTQPLVQGLSKDDVPTVKVTPDVDQSQQDAVVNSVIQKVNDVMDFVEETDELKDPNHAERRGERVGWDEGLIESYETNYGAHQRDEL